MSHPVWSIDRDIATLAAGSLTAQVTLRSPQRGVHNIVRNGTSLDSAQLLCIADPSDTEHAAVELEDAYVRDHDLVADYALAPLGLKLRVYWTARCDPALPDVVVLTLTASLRTDLLDVEPTIRCHSTLTAQAVERLDNVNTAHPVVITSEPVDVSASGAVSTNDTAALLFSCGGNITYAEIPHPTDVRHSLLTRPDNVTDAMTITHDLFNERLEKGVIVRGRIRGLILPRNENAIERIAEQYRTFVAMDPPLDA